MDNMKNNHIAYIVEAALEYFISLLITNAFLASLLTKNGASDASIGIITQLASLAFIAQIFSVFYKKTKGFKKFVTLLHLANQLMFVLVYLIPSAPVSSGIKIALLVAMFLGGHIISNIVLPYKISWLMSYVPDKSRGKFTANKEIVSLIGGIVFSFVMGNISDRYEKLGKNNVAFVICGITIFVLAVLHTVSLLCVKETPINEQNEDVQNRSAEKSGVLKSFASAMGNKTIMKLILIDVMWHFATGIAISFYGSYQINELKFSLSLVAFLSFISSMVRVAFSRFFGKYADKYSWTKMLYICFAIASVGFLINTFNCPADISFSLGTLKISYAQLMFTGYYCMYGAAMAGINSGLMNIIFDFVPKDSRPAALGIKYSFGGLSAFFAALIGSALLNNIQRNGNSFFYFHVYAQQVLSALAFIICLILLLYMKKVVSKLGIGNKPKDIALKLDKK